MSDPSVPDYYRHLADETAEEGGCEQQADPDEETDSRSTPPSRRSTAPTPSGSSAPRARRGSQSFEAVHVPYLGQRRVVLSVKERRQTVVSVLGSNYKRVSVPHLSPDTGGVDRAIAC